MRSRVQVVRTHFTDGITPTNFVPSAQQPLAPGVFQTYVDAMRAHYTTMPFHAYPLPTNLTNITRLHPPGEEVNQRTMNEMIKSLRQFADVDQVLDSGKQATNTWIKGLQNRLNGAVQDLQNTQDLNQWNNTLNQMEADAQRQAADEIHQEFDRLREIGNRPEIPPALQPAALELVQRLGKLWTGLVNDFKNFVVGLVTQVLDWLKQAIQWVEDAVKQVSDWVTGALNDVAGVFGF
jgi:hypothetical protein